jgi:hypothetical protein
MSILYATQTSKNAKQPHTDLRRESFRQLSVRHISETNGGGQMVGDKWWGQMVGEDFLKGLLGVIARSSLDSPKGITVLKRDPF